MSNEVSGLSIARNVGVLSFFAYPRLRDGYGLPPGCKHAAPGERVDAVILTATVPDHALNLVLSDLADPLVPVVCLVPDSRSWIDSAGEGEQAAWERALVIGARLRDLPEAIRFSSQPDDILLARMYSRDRALSAVHDSSSRDLVRYPVAGRLDGVAEVALRLFGQGLVTRTFFDRIHCCPDCRSAILSVREECHSCRSPNIGEETVIHHFRCGHEAPESHFRSGTKFECAKCGYSLRHIGLDYDKPGSISRCYECGGVNDKPTVGFKCIDCGAHHDTEQVPVKTWYSYNLTSAGIQRILKGESAASYAPQRGPDAFQVLLAQTQREHREFKTPYQIALITFANQKKIEGPSIRLWEESVKLMSDALHSALREVDVVREEPDGFLVLMPRTGRRDAKRAMDLVKARMAAVLKIDPGLQYELVDTVGVRILGNQAA